MRSPVESRNAGSIGRGPGAKPDHIRSFCLNTAKPPRNRVCIAPSQRCRLTDSLYTGSTTVRGSAAFARGQLFEIRMLAARKRPQWPLQAAEANGQTRQLALIPRIRAHSPVAHADTLGANAIRRPLIDDYSLSACCRAPVQSRCCAGSGGGADAGSRPEWRRPVRGARPRLPGRCAAWVRRTQGLSTHR